MVGLVCGIAFVLVIAAYIWQAYQINSNLRNLGNQYLIQSEYREDGIGMALTTIGALPQALKKEYPHLVADYYRIDGISCIVAHGDKVFKEDGALGDSTILTMYGFDLVDGDAATALNAPFSVVITEATAVKYFGRTDVVGEALTIRNFAGEKNNFMVTGVMRAFPENSVTRLTATMDNTIFLPLSNADYFGRAVNNWQNLWIAGFVELREGVQPGTLAGPMKQLVEQHADERVAANLTPMLKPLSTYYLDDNNGIVRKMIFALSLVATFILLMAIINFINISVSKSMSRIKAIGMCKLMGSGRTRLSVQLVVESLVVVCLSAALALALYPALAPVFGRIMDKELPGLGNLPPGFYGYYVVGILLLGVAAGIYPALRLSAGNALRAIQGQFTGIGEKHLVRKTLLGIQFMVAIIVLISAVVISRQVNVFFSEDLGYDKNYLITAQVPRDWSPEGLNHMETVRQELLAVPQVENISISYDIPSAPGSGMQQVSRPGAEKGVAMQLMVSDAHYADTYKIPMVAGDF
ncbi:MAG TPA: ABC transporter permease, partial [Parapedobacter sp.]|nr:ABC transporter permease [Parapedobacter sp.]